MPQDADAHENSTHLANVFFIHHLKHLGYTREEAEQRLRRTWAKLIQRGALNREEIMKKADSYATRR